MCLKDRNGNQRRVNGSRSKISLSKRTWPLYPDYNPTPPHVSLLIVKLTHAN